MKLQQRYWPNWAEPIIVQNFLSFNGVKRSYAIFRKDNDYSTLSFSSNRQRSSQDWNKLDHSLS